jgi:hypothetical protein
VPNFECIKYIPALESVILRIEIFEFNIKHRHSTFRAHLGAPISFFSPPMIFEQWTRSSRHGSTRLCKACGSSNQSKFGTEICIHLPGRENLDKPHVFVFPELTVCLDCGFTEFTISESELWRIVQSDAA